MDEAFTGLSGYHRIVDDVVIYDSDITQHTNHIREFRQRCAERKITLNPTKWTFSQPEVPFAGFVLSGEGYKVDTSITEAISKFPTPSNRTDLRSFIGLANQLSASTNAVAGLLTPLRPLLSTKNDFTWATEHDQAFDDAKKSLTVAPTLAFFDTNKPTCLCTRPWFHPTAKKRGEMGSSPSRLSFPPDPESQYAIIELELLAMSWAMSKCDILAGLPHFTVVTDHHPLIPILNNHRLDEIENPRLQRLMTRTMAYNFTAEWVKGTQNYAPAALSRNPVSDLQPHETLGEQDIHNNPEWSIAEIRAITSGGQESVRIQDLRRQADEDEEYQQLKGYIIKGYPDHCSQLLEEVRRYWNVRNLPTLDADLIVHGSHLVIPTKM